MGRQFYKPLQINNLKNIEFGQTLKMPEVNNSSWDFLFAFATKRCGILLGVSKLPCGKGACRKNLIDKQLRH